MKEYNASTYRRISKAKRVLQHSAVALSLVLLNILFLGMVWISASFGGGWGIVVGIICTLLAIVFSVWMILSYTQEEVLYRDR